MKLLDLTVISSIAILYNLFIHHLVSIMFKDLDYETKINRGKIFLLIAGIAGTVIAKLVLKPTKDNKDSVVSKGFYYGGLILVITPLFLSWSTTTDDIKLIIVGLSLGGLVWYSNKVLKERNQITNGKGKSEFNEFGKEFMDM